MKDRRYLSKAKEILAQEPAVRAIQNSQNRPGGVSTLIHHQEEVLCDSPMGSCKIIKTNEDDIFSEDQESKPVDSSVRLSRRFDVSKCGDWFF